MFWDLKALTTDQVLKEWYDNFLVQLLPFGIMVVTKMIHGFFTQILDSYWETNLKCFDFWRDA